MWLVLLGGPAICIAFLINRRSMWLDEASSVYIASRDLSGMIHVLRHTDGVFTFYYGMLHAWLMMFGDSAISVRMLSVIFALSTLPIYYAITQRLFNRNIAFVSTLLLGTSFMFLRYSVETRAYSLELFLCTISLFYFLKARDEPRFTNYLFYALAAMLAIYAHPLAILWPVAHGASLLFMPVSRRFLKGMILCFFAIVAGLIPLGIVVHLNGAHQIDWIARMSVSRFVVDVELLLGGPLGGPLHHSELALLVGLPVIVACRALWQSTQRQIALVLLTWFALPLVMMAIFSLWKPIGQANYFLYTILPAFMLVSIGLCWVADRWGKTVAAAIISLIIAGGITQAYMQKVEDWRSVTAFLQQRARAADGLIVYTPFSVEPLLYSEKEHNTTIPAVLLFPTDVNPRDGFPSGRFPNDLPRSASVHYERIWLVLSHYENRWEKDVLSPLRPFYSETSRPDFGTITLVELHRRQNKH